MNYQSKQHGAIKLLLLFLILAATLWYFKIDVRGFVDSHPEIKTTAVALVAHLKFVWANYFLGIWSFIWETVLVGTLWKGIILPVAAFINSYIK